MNADGELKIFPLLCVVDLGSHIAFDVKCQFVLFMHRHVSIEIQTVLLLLVRRLQGCVRGTGQVAMSVNWHLRLSCQWYGNGRSTTGQWCALCRWI